MTTANRGSGWLSLESRFKSECFSGRRMDIISRKLSGEEEGGPYSTSSPRDGEKTAPSM